MPEMTDARCVEVLEDMVAWYGLADEEQEAIDHAIARLREREREALREHLAMTERALRRYAKHDNDCLDCTCGFDSALAAIAAFGAEP